MISHDLITGLVNTVAGLLVWTNVYRVWKDKQVKGANLLPAVYFTVAGSWQVYFLFSLHQLFAVVGGLTIMFGNLSWVLLATYYRYRKNPAQ